MNLDFGPGIQRDLEHLSEGERVEVIGVILAIPGAFREPARHAGIGLRKIHPRGYWEVRAGLKTRILFRLSVDRALLLRVAGHDEVRRYLKSL